MPKFHYSAVSLKGEQIAGEQVAANRNDVVATLRRNGYYPTQIAVRGRDTGKARINISYTVLASLCTNMAAMIRTGVPIGKALEILKDQQDNKHLKKSLDDIYESVQKGLSLSDAFNEYADSFPPMFINMVEAGEASGSLDECLERAGIYFMRIAKLNSKVKNAMIYPTIILIVLFGLLLVLLLFVIPAFADMYQEADAELPAFTQWLLGASDFITESWFIVIGVIGFIITIFNAWKSSDRGRTTFDRFKLNLPVISKLLLKIYAARFARTFSSLSASGVPLTQALSVTARSLMNRYIEKEIYKVVIDAINRGSHLSTQLEKMGLLPTMIVYLVRLGEESGTMDTLLSQAADFYDDESDAAIQSMISMMEPALIVLMAIIVVPILLGALAPMFDMINVMM